MKTLFRFLLVLCVVLLIAVVAGYFVVTNAGFQKRMLEGQLPAGSSIRSVQVTAGTLKLSELVLVLADGTRVKVAEVDTTFKPLAAVFKRTLQLGVLEVDGLRVDLPEAVAASATTGPVSPKGGTPDPQEAPLAGAKSGEAAKSGEVAKPWESIYAVGQLDWLFDVEKINLNGKLKDGAGAFYAFNVSSGAIRPGVTTEVDASLQLVTSQPIQSGLNELDSEAKLIFSQKRSGGFESLRIESQTSGKDAQGEHLLTLTQHFELSIKGFDETADVVVQFDADLKRPEMFLPELALFGALRVEGEAVARVEGEAMTLSSAGLSAFSNAARVLELELKQALTLGGKQNLTGELVEVKIASLPLAWLGPWLPEGVFIAGAPLSAQVALSGDAGGGLELRALQPIRLGPLTIRDQESLLVEEASLVFDPVIGVDADQSIRYNFKGFQLTDRYGEVIAGEAKGTYQAGRASAANPFVGVTAEVQLKIGLQELFQQPLLADRASVLGGTLALNVKVDGDAPYPVRTQGALRGVRARSLPGQSKDYRFAAQLKPVASEGWALGVNFEAGSVDRPSTRVQLSGQVVPVAEPMDFTVHLTGGRVSQSDLTVLAAAFRGSDSKVGPSGSVSRPSSMAPAQSAPPAPPAEVSAASMPPAWAGLKGDASIQVDQINLDSGHTITEVAGRADISAPLLKLSGLTAKLGAGTLNGGGEVRYAAHHGTAYEVLADLRFSQIDPSIFSSSRSGSIPVKGSFDGNFKLTGSGPSLEAAIDHAQANLMVTGRDGVLTAFELDNRSQLGLLGVGLLGQRLNRPGISALAETIPYFKDMRFQSFVLELNRGVDERVLIPQLKFIGESVLIDGSGFIAASSLRDVMDQPLSLGLELGAKGRLTDYLQTLQLLQPTTSEDGFRRWNKRVNLGGTLSKPNTDELMALLNRAARTALSKPQADAGAVPATGQDLAPTQGKTKAEKRRDEIEMGLDLLNTVLGN